MTRELETKAAASLLKRKFADKGATLTHTEALDTLAQLRGYEAWSHLMAMSSNERDGANGPERIDGGKSPFAERLTQPLAHQEGLTFWELATVDKTVGQLDFETYPQQGWKDEVENGDTSLGYWDWVVVELEVGDGLLVRNLVFQKAPPVAVTAPDGAPGLWDIQQNLTDRWGEVNQHSLEQKPALLFLVLQIHLMERLRNLMTGEDTFIVMKDEAYGLLFEFEYISAESEESAGDQLGRKLPAHAEIVECLCKGLAKLQAEYPFVEFCIPPKEEAVSERPAVWGFVSLLAAEQMTQAEREELALKMSSLSFEVPTLAANDFKEVETPGTTTGRISCSQRSTPNAPKS
jgi:hypothetical protein